MSARNTLASKARRRVERRLRKSAAAKRIGHHGVVVRRSDVLSHRYLAVHRLPYSKSVAAVHIERVVAGGSDEQA